MKTIIHHTVKDFIKSSAGCKDKDLAEITVAVLDILKRNPKIIDQEDEDELTYLVLSEVTSQIQDIPDLVYKVIYEIQEGRISEQLKYVLAHHREAFINQRGMLLAAASNNVEAIQIMLEEGISPEVRSNEYPKQVPLGSAASAGAIEAAELLLNAGAKIDENNNNTTATPLLGAIINRTRSDTEKAQQIKMVKFLIKRGANIHASYFLGNTHLNALKLSVFYGYHELAAIFRSMGVEWIPDTPTQTTPETARIEFLTSHFKTQPLLLPISEIISASVPMSVYIFPPVKRKRKTTVFVTSGLSDFMLETPEDKAEYAFAEYFIELSGNWDLSDEALNQDKFFWPVRWLKMIGRYPHENDIFYGEKYKIDNSILQLSSPECKYLTASVERTHKLDFITPQDGKFVIFYQIIPNIQE